MKALDWVMEWMFKIVSFPFCLVAGFVGFTITGMYHAYCDGKEACDKVYNRIVNHEKP